MCLPSPSVVQVSAHWAFESTFQWKACAQAGRCYPPVSQAGRAGICPPGRQAERVLRPGTRQNFR